MAKKLPNDIARLARRVATTYQDLHRWWTCLISTNSHTRWAGGTVLHSFKRCRSSIVAQVRDPTSCNGIKHLAIPACLEF